jgi:hypothetical protein
MRSRTLERRRMSTTGVSASALTMTNTARTWRRVGRPVALCRTERSAASKPGSAAASTRNWSSCAPLVTERRRWRGARCGRAHQRQHGQPRAVGLAQRVGADDTPALGQLVTLAVDGNLSHEHRLRSPARHTARAGHCAVCARPLACNTNACVEGEARWRLCSTTTSLNSGPRWWSSASLQRPSARQRAPERRKHAGTWASLQAVAAYDIRRGIGQALARATHPRFGAQLESSRGEEARRGPPVAVHERRSRLRAEKRWHRLRGQPANARVGTGRAATRSLR